MNAMKLPLNLPDLRQQIESGKTFDFTFFWGHTPPKDGSINKSCFSQWFELGFEIEGTRYPTTEHWMMAGKARLFEDEEMLQEILVAPDPKSAKALGRKVRNFDKDVWDSNCVEIVKQGNVAKFKQNPDHFELLKSTAGTILVEAAPRDRIWGIGMGAANEKASDPLQWRGRNLLGFVLTEVREELGFYALVPTTARVKLRLLGCANYVFGYSQLLKNIDTFGITVIMIGDTRQIEKNMPRDLGRPLMSGFKIAPLANTIG